jgi:streptogramin lyase
MRIPFHFAKNRALIASVTLFTVLSAAAACNTRNTSSTIITEYPVPINTSVPYSDSLQGITKGPDGNLWFTEPQENKIGKLTI